MKIQRYKHECKYSYTLGATLTFELIKYQPQLVTRVFLKTSLNSSEGIEKIIDMCNKNHIPIEVSDKAFNILSTKGNCFIIGEFKKKLCRLKNRSHIVLVNPSDAGNLGTILRTAVGFGINDIAIIRPAVDVYDPKTIRASMGAFFHLDIEYFDSMENYCERFPDNFRYAFMLTASTPISEVLIQEPFSLFFGNEATGLPHQFAELCTSVVIKHSSDIDSLNLPIAAGIAMYEFTKKAWKTRDLSLEI